MSRLKSLQELEWAENCLDLTDDQMKTLMEKRAYILELMANEGEIDCVDIAEYRESMEAK